MAVSLLTIIVNMRGVIEMEGSQRKYQAGMILSAVLFGTVGIFTKSIDESGPVIACGRGIIGVAALLLIAKISGNPLRISALKGELRFIVGAAAALAANWILSFSAYKVADVSVCSVCLYVYPVIFVLMLAGLGIERLQKKQLILILTAVVGIFLTSGAYSADTAFARNREGIILALGAAVFGAVTVLINKNLRKSDPTHATTFQLAVATVFTLLYIIFTRSLPEWSMNSQTILLLFAMGIIHTGICYTLQFSCIRHLNGASGIVLVYLDPVTAMVLSHLLFGESLEPLQVFGAVLVLGSVLLIQLVGQKR